MKKTYLFPLLLASSVITVGIKVEALTNIEMQQQPIEVQRVETSQQALENLNEEIIAYMSGDFINIHDLKQPYDRQQQLQKLSSIDKAIQHAKKQLNETDNLPMLVSAAELFVLEAKVEVFNGTTLSSADIYADEYLQLISAPSDVASTYDYIDLYELPYGEGQQIRSSKQWGSLSKEEKISYIISMKKLLRSQGNIEDGPSTLHVYELLEVEHSDFKIGAANKLVKTLFGY